MNGQRDVSCDPAAHSPGSQRNVVSSGWRLGVELLEAPADDHLDEGVVIESRYRFGGDALTVAKADRRVPLRRWVSLVGVLDADGRLRVWVDGKPAGAAVEGSHFRAQPAAGMSVGADTGSLVGDYKDAQHWKGKLTGVRLYRGVPDVKVLELWAKVPE